jgi:hypothetical protein
MSHPTNCRVWKAFALCSEPAEKARAIQETGGLMGRRIAQLGFALALVNLAIGMSIRWYFRGDASLGYVLHGRYYFGVPGHYTEVSRWLWQFSWWQIPVLIGTQVFGIICALILWPPKWLRNSN